MKLEFWARVSHHLYPVKEFSGFCQVSKAKIVIWPELQSPYNHHGLTLALNVFS